MSYIDIHRVFGVLLLFIICLGHPVFGEELTIMTTTDFHGHVEKLWHLKPIVESELAKVGKDNFILIDVGDTLEGTFEATFKNGSFVIDVFNDFGYDIWCPGNHDFELSPYRFNDINCTVIGANWKVADFEPKPWVLVERANRKIAIIGLTETNLPYRLLPEEGTFFISQQEALERTIVAVRECSPDLTILVRHDGLYHRGGRLYDLIKNFPEIDLVIGGHTHVEEAGGTVGSSYYIQAGKHADCIGKVKVRFDDKSGEVLQITSKLLYPDTQNNLNKVPEKFKKEFYELKNYGAEKVGEYSLPLKETNDNIATDSALGRFTSDVMLDFTGAQVAIYNRYFGEREYPRKLTRYDLYKIFPFQNYVCAVELTPTQLESLILEETALIKRWSNRSTVFAGVSIELDSQRNVVNLQLPQANSNGKIWVALTDYYMASGGGLVMTAREAINNGSRFVRYNEPIREIAEKFLKKL